MLIEKNDIADAAYDKWLANPPDDEYDAQTRTCEYCAGTGEGFRSGMQGDGWTGHNCEMCAGFGSVAVRDGETYTLALTGTDGLVYRDNQGKFRSLTTPAD